MDAGNGYYLTYMNNDLGSYLVVCPAAVMEKWEMELKKWCRSFTVIQHHETQVQLALKRGI